MAIAKKIKDIFVGDIGTHFQADIKNLVNSESEATLDISGATEMLMVFQKPDGTEKEFTAAFVTDGQDGLLEYITANITDLDIDGAWQYYPWVKYPGGQRRGSEIKFTVYPGRQAEQA